MLRVPTYAKLYDTVDLWVSIGPVDLEVYCARTPKGAVRGRQEVTLLLG